MRNPILALFAAAALTAVAACSSDSPASRMLSPGGSSLDRGGDQSHHDGEDQSDHNEGDGHDKVTICHAAGLAGTTHYVEITVSKNATNAHFDEHGTPRAGHEEDYYENDGDHGCKSGGGVTKTLTSVKTMANGQMVDDPTWKQGQAVTIPRGETRWLFYTITYSLPKNSSGTLSENKDVVCGTLGSTYHCSFNTGGRYSWPVEGSGSKVIQIDLTNNSDCSDHTFTNTVTLTPSKKGSPTSASSSVVIHATCGATITKVLDHVMTEVLDASGNQVGMTPDPTYTGGAVTIPAGETRWLFYRIDYSLPTGVTGTITENANTVCATLGAGNLTCHFADLSGVNGQYSWPVSGTGSMMVQVDLTDNGYNSVCGDRTLTNTAVLTTSAGQTLTATSAKTISFTCKVTFTKTLDHVMTSVLDASGNQVGMQPDPTFTGGAVTIPAGQTRWLFYRIDYSVPAGMTGTITENANTACATLGAGNLTCHFANPNAVNGQYSWTVSGTGSMMVQVDLSDNGYNSVCGDRTFTNTAGLATSGAGSFSAAASTLIHFVCQ